MHHTMIIYPTRDVLASVKSISSSTPDPPMPLFVN
jgi:hypothetical protein